ncbi:MAG: hypothetical protein H6975_03700 [Gammaproteobacteria bacterium]|nr:hypothetical protein [Gammaproteobacteria bacterium]
MIYTNSENYASVKPIFRLPKVNKGMTILDFMKHADFAVRLQHACRETQAPDTMVALGRYLGVSTTMAWNYWTGEKLPSMEKAIEISIKLGICVEWLLTGRGPQRPLKPADQMIDVSDLPAEARAGLQQLVDSIKTSEKHQAA